MPIIAGDTYAERAAAGTLGARGNSTATSHQVGAAGPAGAAGPTGAQGVKGDPGDAANTELGITELVPGGGNIVTAVVANTAAEVNVSGGWTVTVTVGARPVIVEMFVPTTIHSVATSDLTFLLYQDGSLIGASTNFNPTLGRGSAGRLRTRVNPAAGSHTYKIMIKSNNAGNFTFNCGAGFPAQLHVVNA